MRRAAYGETSLLFFLAALACLVAADLAITALKLRYTKVSGSPAPEEFGGG